MKAIILAAGNGERLWPLTAGKPKPLVKIAGKSIIERVVLGLKEAGVEEIAVIVKDPEPFLNLKESYRVKLIRQLEKKGTAIAVYSAKEFCGKEKFLVVSGDHVLDITIYQDLITAGENTLIAIKTPEPQRFGVLEISNGILTGIEEKPQHPRSNLVNAGIYYFEPEIFQKLEKIKPSKRGEYEITDALLGMNVVETEKYWKDIAWPWDLLDTIDFLIKEECINGKVIDSEISGPVVVESGAIVKKSVIEGPAYIGKNAKVGPFSHIRKGILEENAEIGIGVTVKNSILGEGSKAKHLAYIGDSITGEKVNFGACAVTANLRFDKKTVRVLTKRGIIDTGRKKFGAAIGDGVQFGIHSGTMPGVLIKPYHWVMPGSIVKKSILD